MPRFTPLGYDHIVLHVRDQEASRKFYCEELGCTVAKINSEFNIVHLRFGEQLIDLLAGDGPGAAKTGLDHFALSIRCADLKDVAADLRAAGVPVEEIPAFFGAYGVGASLYIRDPDGYRVELKPR